MTKHFIIAFCAVFFTAYSFAQGIQFSNSDWETLKSQAKAEQKILFLDAYTTWCGPCKMMSTKVFPLENVGQFYNANFINAKIDMEKGEGLMLAKEYNVQAYPTFLFIDGDGVLVHTSLGYMSASELIIAGETALNPRKNVKGLSEQYAANPLDDEITLKYINSLISIDSPELLEVGKNYLKRQKNWFSMQNEDLIVSMIQMEDSTIRNYILNNWETYLANKQNFSLTFQEDFPYKIASFEIFFNIDNYKTDDAFKTLTSKIKITKEDKSYNALYAFYLAENDRIPELIKFYKKTAKKVDKTTDLAPIAFNIAERGQNKKDYKYGMKLANKVLKENPKDEYARYAKILLLNHLGQTEESKMLYEELLKEVE